MNRRDEINMCRENYMCECDGDSDSCKMQFCEVLGQVFGIAIHGLDRKALHHPYIKIDKCLAHHCLPILVRRTVHDLSHLNSVTFEGVCSISVLCVAEPCDRAPACYCKEVSRRTC